MVDYDLPRAEDALLELQRARTSSFDIAPNIIQGLAERTGNKGNRSKDIENANADAWLAICALGKALEKEQPCDGKYWDEAIRLTERWKGLLT